MGTKQTLIPWKRVTSEGEGQTARAKVEADQAKTEAGSRRCGRQCHGRSWDRLADAPGGPAILDSERYSGAGDWRSADYHSRQRWQRQCYVRAAAFRLRRPGHDCRRIGLAM